MTAEPWNIYPDTKTSTTTSVNIGIDFSHKTFTSFDEACLDLGRQIAEMVITKQHDYGQENILSAPGGVNSAIVVRLWDKICRLKNLVGQKEPKNESINDTFRDIAGYALVALMVEKGYFILPFKEDEE